MLKRVAAITEQTALSEAEMVSAFRWSDGSGLHHDLGAPHFATLAAAARAWEQVRRPVWAQTYRFTVPRAAAIFDGLTTAGRDVVLWTWQHVGPFPLKRALKALAEDRRRLAAFADTRGAAAIADYLDLLRADLTRVEQTAREVAARPADPLDRPYPAHLSTSVTYGGVQALRPTDRP